MKSFLLALTLIVLSPLRVFALGEVFKVEISGTEYCGDNDRAPLNAANNIDLWVLVVSDEQLTVSTTLSFAQGTTFPVFGHTYLTGPTSAAFVGGVLFIDGSYLTIQGTARLDRNGGVTNLTGTFIQNGLFDLGCFSSGRFTSKKISG